MERHMKIWICDDAPGFLEEYKKLVLQQAEELCLHAEVRTFASGEEILSYAQAGHQADVIFLDILMGELNGIDTAMALREMGVENHIVFITSTPDYAIEGYKAKAFRYILKPIRIDTVRTLLEEILEEGREDSLVVPHGKSSLSVQKEDIVYIERINRKTIIHTQNDEVESAIRLDELEKQLDSRFIRCHKSFIVNFKYCVKLKASEMLLKNGESVSISRPNAQKTKAAFFAYHKKSIVH